MAVSDVSIHQAQTVVRKYSAVARTSPLRKHKPTTNHNKIREVIPYAEFTPNSLWPKLP